MTEEDKMCGCGHRLEIHTRRECLALIREAQRYARARRAHRCWRCGGDLTQYVSGQNRCADHECELGRLRAATERRFVCLRYAPEGAPLSYYGDDWTADPAYAQVRHDVQCLNVYPFKIEEQE